MNGVNPDISWVLWVPIIVGFLFAALASSGETPQMSAEDKAKVDAIYKRWAGHGED